VKFFSEPVSETFDSLQLTLLQLVWMWVVFASISFKDELEFVQVFIYHHAGKNNLKCSS
jgi:hypothetical protein